jgi:hypothetical protein
MNFAVGSSVRSFIHSLNTLTVFKFNMMSRTVISVSGVVRERKVSGHTYELRCLVQNLSKLNGEWPVYYWEPIQTILITNVRPPFEAAHLQENYNDHDVPSVPLGQTVLSTSDVYVPLPECEDI